MRSSHANPLFGRDAETSVLRSELGAALGGEGRLVFVVGEPGIGKTRAAHMIAEEARARGAAVAWGRCHETPGAPVYRPWLQALRELSANQPGAPGRDLAALLPALERDADAPPVVGASPDAVRFELFDRVARALTNASRQRPCVLLLDDLHWADAGSLRLIEFVAGECASMPTLLMAMMREGEPDPGDGTASLATSVVRLGRSVRLSGLGRDAVGELLGEHLDRSPESRVVDQVMGITDGNPYLVIEVAHLLAAGSTPTDGVIATVPPGARALLRRRLAALDPDSRRALEVAAVLGREFELAPLARALEWSDTRLLDALGRAHTLGLVSEVPESLRRFAFAHALLRETVVAELEAGSRVAVHASVAEALETLGGESDERLPMLAYHFFEAAQAGDPSKAIRYGLAAGERALAQIAFEEAIRHFERGLSACALAGKSEARWRLLSGLAQALRGAGQRERALPTFREAVAAARSAGPTALGSAVLRFARAERESLVVDVEMNTLLEETVAGLPRDPSTLRARLLALLAAGLQLQPGEERRRRRLSDEAIAMARELGDPGTLSFVLTRRLLGLLGPDQLAERMAITDEVLASNSAPRSARLEGLMSRIDSLAEIGDRAGLDSALAIYEQRANASGQPVFQRHVVRCHAALALLEGRFAEAERDAKRAFELGSRFLAHSPGLEFAQQIFVLRGWQGRLAEVGPLLESSAERARVVPAWRCALAEYYAISGRESEARREFEALAVDDFAGLPRDGAWLTSMVLLADSCARLDDAARAETLYALLKPFAGRVAVASPLVVAVTPIDGRLGVLATLRADYAQAAMHFDDAFAIARRMRALPWQAELRYQRAEMLRRRAAHGDREEALVELDEAAAIAEAVGMPLLLDWIAARRERVAQQRVLSRAAVGGRGAVHAVDAPRSNVVSLAPRAAAAAASAARAATGTFRREGAMWTLIFEDHTSHFRHLLGFSHLARLMREPDREVAVADLVGEAYAHKRETPAGAPIGDAGEQLDDHARAEYRARLADARVELEEAQRLHDRGRSDRLVIEIEFLTDELSRGYGLGGRERRAGSSHERARVAVTRAIKYAIDKIDDHDPALADHLRRNVRTGAVCIYAPPSRDRISWTL